MTARLYTRWLLALIAVLALYALSPISVQAYRPPAFFGLDGQRNGILPPGEGEEDDDDVDPPGSFPQIPPAALSLSSWSAIGPAPIVNGQIPGARPVAGRTVVVAAHPTDANTLYISTASGGVWKTIDGGTSWTPLTDTQAALTGGAVAVSQSNPNIVYAGTGEADNSGDSFYGRGVLKSTDAGATWTLLGTAQFDRKAITRVVIHPTDPNTVYLTTGTCVNVQGGNRGVWKTTDGGNNWTNTTVPSVTPAQFAGTYSDLLMHPTDPLTLYCAVGDAGGNTKNGVYKTSNGGTTWAIAGNYPTGVGSGNGRISIAISKSNPLVLYSIISTTSSGSLLKMLKTTDGGVTWTQLAGVPNFMGGQGTYDQVVAVDPSNSDVVYCGGQSGANGFIKSEDGGATWHGITVGVDGHGPHVDHHHAVFDANGKLVIVNDGGVWRLDDPSLSNLTWTDLNGNLQITQFVGICMHPTDPNIAYGGSQDNGTEKFTGVLGWTAVRGADGGRSRIDTANPSTVYATFEYLPTLVPNFVWRSDDGGSTWAAKQSGINTADGGNFYLPIILDKVNPTRLLLGTIRIYETTDRAENWTPISAPNTNGWVGGTVDAIATSPQDINTIYATASGGGAAFVYVTFDRGATWSQRNSGVAVDHLNDIQIDPTDKLTAYVVRDRFNTAAVGHVWKTTNGGLNWTNISGNLPDVPVESIEIVSNNPGQADDVLYIGTDIGVYRSKDGGTTWTRQGIGLPNVQVTDLESNSSLGILTAGTYGRGAWQINLPTSPSIASLGNASTVCGQTYTSPTPSASGTTPLTWTLVSGPSGMTIDSGTGVVTWPVPVASQASYSVTLKAENDGGGFDTKSYQLKVKPGDFNGDGLADDVDVPALVSCLLDPPNCSRPCAADVNNDTVIDGLDAQAWVNSSLTP